MAVEPSLVAAHPDVEGLLDGRGGAQRARLLEGMVQAVAEKGYAAATVADAVRAARVSRGTFYALFASKEECFLEAYRHGVDVLVDRVRAAARAERGDWVARLRAALRAYLITLATEPRFARTHLLEIHAAGPRAQVARDAALRRFADRYGSSFRAALREEPRERRMPSADALFVLAAGVDQLVCARLRERDAPALTALEDQLVQIAVAFLEGASALGGRDAPTPPDDGGP
jgi:AcrR family transcriptional regulator